MRPIQIVAILIVIAVVGSTAGYILLSGTEPGPEETAGSVTITQNNGEKVVVKTPVKKVGVVNPNAAEFMKVLNVTDKVVGVSESILEDTEFGYIYDGVPSIGTYGNPNGEKLLELGADLVIGQCSAMTIKDPEALQALGITVVLLDCYGLDQQTNDLRQLAKLFGPEAQERAEQYIQMFSDVVLKVTSASASFGKDVNSYMELSGGKAYTSKAEMTSLINLAGGHNIVTDLIKNPKSSSVELDDSVVIAYNQGYGPEFVFIRYGGIDDAAAEAKYNELTERNGWGGINATKNDNIYIVTQSGILSGPRIFIGLVYLAELFHPGVLDISAAELLQEYNEAFGFDISLTMDYHHVSAGPKG